MHTRPHFFDLDPAALTHWCTQEGLPRFAAAQIMDWVYRKGVIDPALMSNLSRAARQHVAQAMRFESGRTVAHQHATDGTQKLLIEWIDTPRDGGESDDALALTQLSSDAAPAGRRTECVMIPTDTRRTACLSSQAGCPVGCSFCASGIGGLEGNLSAGRIVEQAWRLEHMPEVGRLTNIVFMGMGEPLANYGEVTRAIRTLCAPWGMALGARRITVSTVGLPRAIRRFAAFDIPVNLALSLHAPNDALRRELIPWAEYSTVEELVDACHEYFETSGREITFEYLLLRNVNDRPEHADELAELAKRTRANVNLIRYNEVAGLPFRRPVREHVLEFQAVLRRHGVNTHIRRSRGRDIAAACGQLRHERAAAKS